MFILNMIFDNNSLNGKNPKVRTELIKLLLKHSSCTKKIYKKYIPENFFIEIENKYNNDPGTY